MGEKNEIIKHEAQNLDIKFPHNSKLTEKENLLPQKAIKETGIIDSKGKAYIGKKKIKDILVTDKAGANKFYNNLDDEDKFENGNEKYASVAACQKEIESGFTKTLLHGSDAKELLFIWIKSCSDL